MRVKEFIDSDTRCWKIDEIREVFGDDICEKIILIPLSLEPIDDCITWRMTSNSGFTM